MAERGLGYGSVSLRIVRDAVARSSCATRRYRCRDVSAGVRDVCFALLSLAGGRGVALWHDGRGARRLRRCHEHLAMQAVPPHFMGRVQNAYNFVGTVLQVFLSLAAAHVAHAFGLVYGFAVIGAAYVFAFLFAAWPVAEVESANLVVSG